MADDLNEPFYKLATFGAFDDGQLKVVLWQDDATWVNGIPHGRGDDVVFLKPGDVVICFFQDMNYFKKFRLDSLTASKASFTYHGYESRTVDENGRRKYMPGKLESTEIIQLDLTKPNGLLVDYGPNHVELGSGITLRSKN